MRLIRVRLNVPLAVTLATAGFLSAEAAYASETWFVATTGDDANDCFTPDMPCASIQGAIDKAESGDTIRVDTGVYAGIGNWVVQIDKDLTLLGGWDETFQRQTGSTTVDGENMRGGIRVEFGPIVFLERFLIRNCGPGDFGGRGISNSGTLTLTQCAVENNEGGAIWNDITLLVNESTISGNSACCGGNGGGIENHFIQSTVTLNNSTVSGNHAAHEGGGIYLGGGFVSLNNSTVMGNSAGFGGGGISNRTDGTVELQNTVIAENTSDRGPDCWDFLTSTYESKGYNLIGNTAGCSSLAPGPGDLFDVAPLFGPLQDNGGPTRTHRPEIGSPAIDAGNPSGCTDANGILLASDQRGATRPQGTNCDIGAVEFATGYFTLRPCRLADTRKPIGPSGGPALQAEETRGFPVTGLCDVPSSAIAVAVSLTVVGANAAGHLRLYPAGAALPDTSAINFGVGVTRANNAVVPVGSGGQIAVYCRMASPLGQTHFVLDVFGYFE